MEAYQTLGKVRLRFAFASPFRSIHASQHIRRKE